MIPPYVLLNGMMPDQKGYVQRDVDGGWAEWREWLEFLIEKILKPRGYSVSGELVFEGDAYEDMFIVRVDAKGIVNYDIHFDSRVIPVMDLKLQPAGIDQIIRRLKRLHKYDLALREYRGLDEVITLLERLKEVV